MAGAKSTEVRNAKITAMVYGMDTILLKAADTTTLATVGSVSWAVAASGAVSLSGTVTDASADAGSPTNMTNAVLQHTNGTASGYLVDTASAAVGEPFCDVDTGTGTFLRGDIITFAGDTQQYMITKDHSGGDGTIYFFPDLQAAPADDAAITLGTARTITGMSVGTSGSDFNFDTVAVTAGQSLDITSGTITEPASTD